MATQSKGRPRRIWQWADVRGRQLGMWAYILNRLSGLGLTLYLFLHLGVLSTLTQGPAGWDSFVALAKQPAFLALDVLLLTGLLIHSLNGLRVTLTGLGFGVRAQKPVFVGLMVLALALAAAGAWAIFSK